MSLALLLGATLAASSALRASVPGPSPLAAPTIQACTYIPNPRANLSLACGDTSLHAVANESVFFQVNVSDATANAMTVTFDFDYWSAIGQVNPASPNRTVEVSAPAPGVTVSANVTWMYTAPNANLSGGQYFVFVNVTNDAGEFTDSGTYFFPVYVAYDQAPFMDGLQSLNSVSPAVHAANPVVPLVYENVTVGDPDADPVTVTWDWGDGTRTVTTTAALTSPLDLRVTHRYAASFLPLNETPRYFDVPVVVWIDDGAGHNASLSSTTEFYLEFDAPPSVRIDRPTVGSIWKVNETVTMGGNVSDPEGSPTTAYWDFDNRTDSTQIGDPTRNMDALGATASHQYASPGVYNITLWATDGDKETCINANCSIFTTHWVSAVQPITVVRNRPPVLAIVNATAEIGSPALLRASVYDPDGDSMNVTWTFGDGSPDAFNLTGRSPRSAPVVFTVYQEHAYAALGGVTYTVSVSDGNVTSADSKTVFVGSLNLPPVISQVLVLRTNGLPAYNLTFVDNETVIVDLSLFDPENDALDISLGWGDLSLDNQTTVYPSTSSECIAQDGNVNLCALRFTHFYTGTGGSGTQEYRVVLTVTDNKVYLRQNLTGGPPVAMDHSPTYTFPVWITSYAPPVMPPLVATATFDAATGTVPFTAAFHANASGGTPPYTYAWDFGDGGTSPEQSPSHTYQVAGTYDVTVTVTDSQGRAVTRTERVTAYPPTVAGNGVPSWAYYAIATVAVAAAASLAAWWVWRGRRQSRPPIAPPP